MSNIGLTQNSSIQWLGVSNVIVKFDLGIGVSASADKFVERKRRGFGWSSV